MWAANSFFGNVGVVTFLSSKLGFNVVCSLVGVFGLEIGSNTICGPWDFNGRLFLFLVGDSPFTGESKYEGFIFVGDLDDGEYNAGELTTFLDGVKFPFIGDDAVLMLVGDNCCFAVKLALDNFFFNSAAIFSNSSFFKGVLGFGFAPVMLVLSLRVFIVWKKNALIPNFSCGEMMLTRNIC